MKDPNEKDKRMIDDPQLNQDVSFDRKDEEDFDDSDDFHKYDDTDEDKPAADPHTAVLPESQPDLNSVNKSLNSDGQFDGNIAI
ncbi:hypothetical protein [Flavobacterium sp.]|uniref:hypothetical protein n=1 Tax=Flavobacterium sp. TaxID=239 RepID=UPI0039E56805